MNAVQSLVEKKRWLEAAQYVVEKGHYATVSQLTNEEAQIDAELSDEDCPSLDRRVVYGMILSIKNPKDKEQAKKLAYQRLGKPLAAYKRLLLLREPQEGKAFYLIAANDAEAYRLFTIPNVAFYGTWVAVYEPQAKSTIHGIPVLSTATSLVPIELSPATSRISLNSTLGGVTANEPIQTFLLEVQASRIKLEQVGLIKACSSVMCDSAHTNDLSSEVKCPGMAGGRKGSKALTCTVTVRKHGIYRAHYCSETFAKLFMSNTVLQAADIDQDLVREGMEKKMQELSEKGVDFIVAGWFKLSTTAGSQGEAATQKRNIHVSMIRPKILLKKDELLQLTPTEVRQPPVATASAAVPHVEMAQYMTGNLSESSDEETRIEVHRHSDGTSAGTSGNTRRRTLQSTRATKKLRTPVQDEEITLEARDDESQDREITVDAQD